MADPIPIKRFYVLVHPLFSAHRNHQSRAEMDHPESREAIALLVQRYRHLVEKASRSPDSMVMVVDYSVARKGSSLDATRVLSRFIAWTKKKMNGRYASVDNSLLGRDVVLYLQKKGFVVQPRTRSFFAGEWFDQCVQHELEYWEEGIAGNDRKDRARRVPLFSVPSGPKATNVKTMGSFLELLNSTHRRQLRSRLRGRKR